MSPPSTAPASRHNADNDTASHILTLWGMANLGSSQTDVYTLAMTMTRTRPVREPKKRALAWIDS
ncbi:hypothetical protein GSUET_08520 [Geobacter sulfurreducens subsp. ethanolicus]|nr:hypothetical protein GSUET_08520 [Geobacter sulfurreducens subsp. ethanolicus]